MLCVFELWKWCSEGAKTVLKFSKFSDILLLSTNFSFCKREGHKKDYWIENNFIKNGFWVILIFFLKSPSA
jgi:hypothetical protein